MKILISEIEKKIPYKLKRNFKSIGVDTAQITGIVLLRTDNENLYIDYQVIGFKTQVHKEMYHSMVKAFEKILEPEYFAVIEEVFIGFSRAGSAELAKYGAFAIAEAIKKDMNYATILAVSARAKFGINTMKYGKGQSKKCVAEWVDGLGIKLNDNNLVDAFVLALCGICEKLDFMPQKTKKKSTKKSKKAKKK
jgi:hypothetical protein